MPGEYPYKDATNDPSVLSRAAKEVVKSRRSQLVKIGEDEVVEVSPVEPTSKTPTASQRRHQPIPSNDPLFKIIGMFNSHGPGDVAENVDKYLAEAYYSEFHPAKEK